MSEKLLEYFNGDDLASGVWSGKYAEKGEVTPDDMHRRMAKEFAKVEEEYFAIENVKDNWDKLSQYGKHRDPLTEKSIYKFFKDFKHIIPQGSIMSQLGADSIGSLSNCFVVGQPVDSYGGIFQKEQEMIQLMKRRGGVGIDISTLRPEGTLTTNAAKSSTGAVSFMHRFSNGTREVAQKGRRGALMLSIDIKHPDSLEFIKIKRDLTQVTGANISIKLDAEFMEAVEKDADFILRFPCDYKIVSDLTEFLPYNELKPWFQADTTTNEKVYLKKIKAKEYWNEIIKSAHNVAEPGLMFWDTMVNYSPDGVYEQFKQVTTNPCSEIGMQPYDACRLIAVNLFSFVVDPWTASAHFDHEKFYEVNYEAMRLSDDLIDLEIKHIDRIIAKIEADPEDEEIKYVELKLWHKVRATAQASRRTGLGVTALGDALAAMGMKYDSDRALSAIESIMQTKMSSELDCTIDLAILRGTFEGWDKEIETKIIEDENGIKVITGANPFYEFMSKEFPEQYKRMYFHGRRNVSWSTVAPTGSLSIMAKLQKYSNVTSGLEPVFAPFYMRRKKVNTSDKTARVDFTDQNGDTWQEYPVMMAGFKEWIVSLYDTDNPIWWECQDLDITKLYTGISVIPENKDVLQKLYEKSPYWGSTANDIDWVRRVEIQGIIQKYITHSISSTINLPSTVSEEEVSRIYLESHKKGLKGITVYRDGSRSGVLVSNDAKKETGFEYRDAVKRPVELDAEMHVVNVKGSKFTILVGFLDKKPYEVFGFDHTIEDGKAKKGKLTKAGKGKYSFNGIEISCEMSDEQAAITRLVSTSLRHGSDIKFIVEQLNKTDGDLFSFTKGLARVLKKYIPEGAKSTVHCLDCGSDQVIFQEGCQSCQSCGSSKCG
jgi:ribonucleoside-diphosphate reductase alpha chain